MPRLGALPIAVVVVVVFVIASRRQWRGGAAWSHEQLDAFLCCVQQVVAAPGQRDAAFVRRQRFFERKLATLELADDQPQLLEHLIKRSLVAGGDVSFFAGLARCHVRTIQENVADPRVVIETGRL